MAQKNMTDIRMYMGVGINDADYKVQKKVTISNINGKQIQKQVWICPYYKTWSSMLTRCYNEKSKTASPTYEGAFVCEEWLTFSNFKAWMEQQDWEEKELDKDLLVRGSKIYSPVTCCFISGVINRFITESSNTRGKYKIGVDFLERNGKYRSQCSNPLTGKTEYIGLFDSEEEAHCAWVKKKLEYAQMLVSEHLIGSAADALIDRYENYGTNK